MSMLKQLEVGNSSMSIDASLGAALRTLVLDGVELIKPMPGYHFESSLLFPFPNRLAEGDFHFEGQTYVFEKNDFGRPNALHGFVHDMNFEVNEYRSDRIVFSLTYHGERSQFPFPFQLTISYILGVHSLDVLVSVKNIGDVKLPFGFGWHPYFLLKQKSTTSLKLPACQRVLVNQNLVPTGEQEVFREFADKRSLVGHKLDNCFAFSEDQTQYSTLLSLDSRIELEVWQDHQFPFLQVFTPEDDLTVALEPMTCNIDALNNGEGLLVLTPGEAWSGSFGLRLKK